MSLRSQDVTSGTSACPDDHNLDRLIAKVMHGGNLVRIIVRESHLQASRGLVSLILDPSAENK